MNATQHHVDNVEITTDDDFIVIRIDRHKRFGLSASGKTLVIASTRGNVRVTADGIVLGLNAYVYADQQEQVPV
jgi:hypothetical protein